MEFNLKSNFDTEKKVLDVHLAGEIDIYNSADVKEELSKLVAEHNVNLNLHCEELDYLDSTALGALVSVLKKVKHYDGNIYIKNAKASVCKIFKITNLDKAFILEGECYE